MYCIAMAYCGTGNNEAIRKLLHVAVSFEKNKYLILKKNKQDLIFRLATLMMMFVDQLLNHLDFLCFGKMIKYFHQSFCFDIYLSIHFDDDKLSNDESYDAC
jgi:hypothetical protein